MRRGVDEGRRIRATGPIANRSETLRGAACKARTRVRTCACARVRVCKKIKKCEMNRSDVDEDEAGVKVMVVVGGGVVDSNSPQHVECNSLCRHCSAGTIIISCNRPTALPATVVYIGVLPSPAVAAHMLHANAAARTRRLSPVVVRGSSRWEKAESGGNARTLSAQWWSCDGRPCSYSGVITHWHCFERGGWPRSRAEAQDMQGRRATSHLSFGCAALAAAAISMSLAALATRWARWLAAAAWSASTSMRVGG
jgi:hypothetical protein